MSLSLLEAFRALDPSAATPASVRGDAFRVLVDEVRRLFAVPPDAPLSDAMQAPLVRLVRNPPSAEAFREVVCDAQVSAYLRIACKRAQLDDDRGGGLYDPVDDTLPAPAPEPPVHPDPEGFVAVLETRFWSAIVEPVARRRAPRHAEGLRAAVRQRLDIALARRTQEAIARAALGPGAGDEAIKRRVATQQRTQFRAMEDLLAEAGEQVAAAFARPPLDETDPSPLVLERIAVVTGALDLRAEAQARVGDDETAIRAEVARRRRAQIDALERLVRRLRAETDVGDDDLEPVFLLLLIEHLRERRSAPATMKKAEVDHA